MSLTPEEIAEKEFAFGLRGYDQEEVRSFLRLVAAEVTHGDIAEPSQGDAADGAAPTSTKPSVGGSFDADREAAAILERAHDEADEIRQSAAAEAEIVRSRARAVLSAAQDQALRLVAETHARIDRRSMRANASSTSATSSAASANRGEGSLPASTVEQLGAEISALVQARDEVLNQLHVVKSHLDGALAQADENPVLRRGSVEPADA